MSRAQRETVREELRDGVLLLTLDRPRRKNAFNERQYDDLRLALAAAREDGDVRVVVVTGAPGAFSAGQDISELGKPPTPDGEPHGFTPFVDELSTFDKPLVAAVNGVAVGIGVTLLLHCDLVYVAESARLRAPFVALGLVPEAGSTLLLPLVVGPQAAAELLLGAPWIDARRAVEIGLARRAVPDEELLDVALGQAREIARQAPAAVREAKRLLLATRAEALLAAREREERIQAHRIGSPENREAVRAFEEKRPPDFDRFRG